MTEEQVEELKAVSARGEGKGEGKEKEGKGEGKGEGGREGERGRRGGGEERGTSLDYYQSNLRARVTHYTHTRHSFSLPPLIVSGVEADDAEEIEG